MLPVLVVEDDADIREALTLLLRDEGYRPMPAATLDEALALVDEQTFALILTDLFARSPERPLDTAAALRARAHPTPVAVLTGWNPSPGEIEAAGFAFVAHKPFDVDELAASIAAALGVALSPDEEERAKVVRRYFDLLTARDWEGVAELCTDDVTYVLPGNSPFSTTVQGKAAFRAFTEETFRQFPGGRFEDVRVYATPKGIAARYQSYWLAGDVGELRQAGSAMFQFDDTRIRQIGVRLNDERLHALLEAAMVEAPHRRGNGQDERKNLRRGPRPAGSD